MWLNIVLSKEVDFVSRDFKIKWQIILAQFRRSGQKIAQYHSLVTNSAPQTAVKMSADYLWNQFF